MCLAARLEGVLPPASPRLWQPTGQPGREPLWGTAAVGNKRGKFRDIILNQLKLLSGVHGSAVQVAVPPQRKGWC